MSDNGLFALLSDGLLVETSVERSGLVTYIGASFLLSRAKNEKFSETSDVALSLPWHLLVIIKEVSIIPHLVPARPNMAP
ncbi:hypothetical protein AERO9A_430063 [Aeromonas salmonicida]|nr:hypothetical protein AERO9A_430063 [Aeromonas salmonicida]